MRCMEQFSEATVGFRLDTRTARSWVQAFGTPYFHVAAVHDVEGVELCGTLKNVVAIAAVQAAIIRIGLHEMICFSKLLFPTVSDITFFESCGVADLITTCFGGRNRKVAEAFARSEGKRSFDELEAELLGGQKLQGVLTAAEVFLVVEDTELGGKVPTICNCTLDCYQPPASICHCRVRSESSQAHLPNPSASIRWKLKIATRRLQDDQRGGVAVNNDVFSSASDF